MCSRRHHSLSWIMICHMYLASLANSRFENSQIESFGVQIIECCIFKSEFCRNSIRKKKKKSEQRVKISKNEFIESHSSNNNHDLYALAATGTHSALCCGFQSFFWHSSEQYHTFWHREH